MRFLQGRECVCLALQGQYWCGFAGKMFILSIKSSLEQKKRKFAFRGLQQEGILV